MLYNISDCEQRIVHSGVAMRLGKVQAAPSSRQKHFFKFYRYSKTNDIWLSNTRMFYCSTPNLGSGRFVHVGETFNRLADFRL